MSETVTTTNTNGLKPNKPLYKTNYFANLKRKASTKDIQEQMKLNKELLNCIKQLSVELEKVNLRLDEASKGHDAQFVAISTYVNSQLVPYVRSIAVATGCVASEEDKKEETEGGETMDAGLCTDQNDQKRN